MPTLDDEPPVESRPYHGGSPSGVPVIWLLGFFGTVILSMATAAMVGWRGDFHDLQRNQENLRTNQEDMLASLGDLKALNVKLEAIGDRLARVEAKLDRGAR